jgi:hypothetical protein
VAISLLGFKKISKASEIFFTMISAFFIADIDNPSSPKTAMPRPASFRISWSLLPFHDSRNKGNNHFAVFSPFRI